jgi:hypothetical protein
MVENHERTPPVKGRKSYEKSHKKMCEALQLHEVRAPRVYASVARKCGDKVVELNYNRDGSTLSRTTYGPDYPEQQRFRRIILPEAHSRARVNKLVWLSHVLTQCGIREKAIRPLWRLLRVGYKIRWHNFKRLCNKVAFTSDYRHDFTRDLGAPAKGLRYIPRFDLEARTLVVKGIIVPRWTKIPHYCGSIQDLNLD